MKTLQLIGWLSVLAVWTQSAQAQITIQRTASQPYRYSQQEMLTFSVANSGPAVRSTLTATLKKGSGQTINMLTLSNWELPGGITTFTPADFERATQSVASPELYRQFVNGSLPPGAYVSCINVAPVGSQATESCQEVKIEAASPPRLVFPGNETSVRESNPVLTWTPAVTAATLDQGDVKYQLRVFEVLGHQTVAEAALRNRPLLNTQTVDPSLTYPMEAQPLQKGRTYAWQVTALYDGETIGNSELWSFTLGDRSQENTEQNDGFILLGTETHPLEKIEAAQYLRFQIEGFSSRQRYTYNVINSEGKPVLRRARDLEGTPGDNRYTLDLYTVPKLRKGQEYTLKLTGSNGATHNLKFTYTKNEN